MSTEMGIKCQRNGHWAATNHPSGRGLLQPIKELSSAAGRCAGRGCALIGQLANVCHDQIFECLTRSENARRQQRHVENKV